MSAENFRDWLVAEEVQAAHEAEVRAANDPAVQEKRRKGMYRSIHKSREPVECTAGRRVKTKAAVPRQCDQPPRVERAKKNFVLVNAVSNILGTAEGHIQARTSNGRREGAINYLKKKDFGKKPAYLERVKREISREFEERSLHIRLKEQEEEEARGREQLMDDDDRHALVEQLKEKWDELNRQYQLQAHVVQLDTAGKIARKERLEKQLKRVEAAIEKLEKPVIVCDVR